MTAGGLFLAAVVGGTLNAVSGGGTFVCFPSLLLAGVPAVSANATNTVALWPGVLSSTVAYRKEFGQAPHRLLLFVPSIAGGALGALVLLKTPSSIFEGLVPYLLLFATLLFAFGPAITRRFGPAGGPEAAHRPALPAAAAVAIQFVLALYGGYFGGGVGILILAALGVMGVVEFHIANALRTFLAVSINGVAVVAFVVAGAVAWPEASVMLVGSIAGGYGGVTVIRRIKPALLRRTVIGIGLGMTAYLFFRAYSG
ncbi:MAG: sulfite exporter TauE/SafE family protein [Chloroflexota bacterium]|nr:sulfite exporter TauE/SafE family protein [Chloroflexota bacterium]